MLKNLLFVMLFALAAQANAAVCTVTLSGDWSASTLHIEEANGGVDTVINATSDVWFRGGGIVTFTYSGVSGVNAFSYSNCGGQSLNSGTLQDGEIQASSGSLPVDLIFFGVFGNYLKWQTAWEENNNGFEVQHASDGSEFRYLDFVKGAGTTTEVQDYQFAISKGGYYRLKQVDYDGKFEYSDIVYFKGNGKTETDDYKVFANKVVFTEPKHIKVYHTNGAFLYEDPAAQEFTNTYRQVVIVKYEGGVFRLF